MQISILFKKFSCGRKQFTADFCICLFIFGKVNFSSLIPACFSELLFCYVY